MYTRLRLGDTLVQKGIITQEQLNIALKEHKKTGRKLGATLISLKMVKENDLLNILAEQLRIPFLRLEGYNIKPEIVQLLPERQARRYRTIVLDKINESYLIGMADPSDLLASDEVARQLKLPVRQAVVKEKELLHAFEKGYGSTADDIANIAVELNEEVTDKSAAILADEEMQDSDVPVMKLLESIFKDAVQMGASDVHIEPDEKVLRIRQRVDGVLVERVMDQKNIAAPLVLRLKLMAKLNISEKRLPQDGRFNLKVLGKRIDIRLSTMPIQYGESVVMRILDFSSANYTLDQLGLPESLLQSLRKHIHSPHGMILVTGPTGSGKTTTLYACLHELNKSQRKIITVEDPVEYTLSRINQVQTNQKISLSFSRVLRAALRQDPDVIMVGEMRDQETASIGLRAAMTGHLVLSTLHTNDAISSAIRLIDMGAEGYLTATALRAVIAQRLVRKVCQHCAAPHQPDEHELSWITTISRNSPKSATFRMGKGCNKCNKTGYHGRLGVYELLELKGPIVDALRDGDSTRFSSLAKRSLGFRPLSHCALEYAIAGVTTLEEVFRIAGEIEDLPETAEENDADLASEG